MTIRNDEERRRFVLESNGRQAALSYQMRGDDHIHFVSTWVPPQDRSLGNGARLVKAGLDYAREHGLRVSTSCWFVEEFVERRPEYQDLMAD